MRISLGIVIYSQSREPGNIGDIRRMQWWRKEVRRETSSQLYDTEKRLKEEEDCARRHNTVQSKTK